jgi:catechol 2,3-dioxygenase-like lactoylglutathione lyase family enzyme
MKDLVTGIQHLGIPTNDINKTINFYCKLGFEIVHQTTDPNGNVPVAFLQLKNLVIETYENKCASLKTGSLDHFALDVIDIDQAFESIRSSGFQLLDQNVQFLPFWRNGVKFFTIMGPNSEKIEFCQKM